VSWAWLIEHVFHEERLRTHISFDENNVV
jgi:hypothetical protein